MGLLTQKRVALTDSRRLLALIYHHFPEHDDFGLNVSYPFFKRIVALVLGCVP